MLVIRKGMFFDDSRFLVIVSLFRLEVIRMRFRLLEGCSKMVFGGFLVKFLEGDFYVVMDCKGEYD